MDREVDDESSCARSLSGGGLTASSPSSLMAASYGDGWILRFLHGIEQSSWALPPGGSEKLRNGLSLAEGEPEQAGGIGTRAAGHQLDPWLGALLALFLGLWSRLGRGEVWCGAEERLGCTFFSRAVTPWLEAATGKLPWLAGSWLMRRESPEKIREAPEY